MKMKEMEHRSAEDSTASSEVGILLVGADFTVQFMNPRMAALFGQGKGRKCYQVIGVGPGVCPWCPVEDRSGPGTVRRELSVLTLGRTIALTETLLSDDEGGVRVVASAGNLPTLTGSGQKSLQAERDHRFLFDHAGSGVYLVDGEGNFVALNKALLDMLGYGRKGELPDDKTDQVLFRRREESVEFRNLLLRDGLVLNHPVDFRLRNGRPIAVLLSARAHYDLDGKLCGYEAIVSQRKWMLKELREAHDFMKNLIQSSPNAIIATGMGGDIILWSRGAEEILGYKAKEVVGKANIRKFYPQRDLQNIIPLLRQSGGSMRSHPMKYVGKNGETVEGSLSAAFLYDEEGRESGIVGIFADLKERIEMERKLRQTQDQLLQSEKLAALGRLTSQIAHELNNPLYGIMNAFELMKTEIDPKSKRRRVLDMALSETVRLTDLLRKMLSFSRPDQDEKQPVDINTILDEILLLHGKLLRENDIHLSCSFGKSLGSVMASKNQLRQVFLNMITNARDAMPTGGSLSITTKAVGEEVHVEITDTGTGILPEHKGRIFDAFFSTKEGAKGVGLGLSVCFIFIREHGGDIRVQSEWGAGTAFTIILPIAARSND